MAWVSLCEHSELIADMGKPAQVDGFSVAVFLHEGEVYVVDDECPHAGAPLAGGAISQHCVVCPLHGWGFDLRDGQMKRGTAFGAAIQTYPVRLHTRDDGVVLVQAKLPMP